MSKAKVQNSKNIFLVPLALILAVIPLIVYVKEDMLSQEEIEAWKGGSEVIDLFSYYKAQAFIIIASISAILFLYKYLSKKYEIRKSIIYAGMAAYSFSVLISSVVSKHKSTVWVGFAERYEGAIVLVLYMIIFFIAMSVVQSEKDMKTLLYFLTASSVCIALITVFQKLGLDIFRLRAVRLLILPSDMHYLVDNVRFEFGERSAYATLYNPNYLGSYFAMLIPIVLMLAINHKKKLLKAIFGALLLLFIAALISSESRAGLVGIVAAVLVLILLKWKSIIKQKVALTASVLVVIIALGVSIFSDNFLSTKVQSVFNELKRNQGFTIDDILLEGNKLTIRASTESVSMLLDGNQLMFLDGEDKPFNFTTTSDGKILLGDEKYAHYVFSMPDENNVIKCYVKGKVIYILVQSGGFKLVGAQGKLYDKVDKPEAIGFKGREKLGSMRGYIWSRTFPLLKKTLFFGTGPDSFIFAFPQYDYLGKLNAYGSAATIVDKPHNMYLQAGVNTGVISMLALIFMLGWYFIRSFKLYMNRKLSSFTGYAGVGIFLAVVGYAVAGLFNDSVISVAPVFWVLFGMGVSCNYMLIKEIEKGKFYDKKEVKKL